MDPETHAEPQLPRCPKCGHQPLNFACNIVPMQSSALVSIIWCGDCGHTINMHYLGQVQAPERLIVGLN